MSVRVRREAVAYATGRGLSQRRTFTLLSVARSALAYQARKPAAWRNSSGVVVLARGPTELLVGVGDRNMARWRSTALRD